MTDGDQYVASLQWAINQQKSDLENIKKQLRRYLVAIVTVIVVRFAAFIGDSGSELGSSQEGVLQQSNAISPELASAFTEMAGIIAASFSGFGIAALGTCLYGVVILDSKTNCLPISDFKNISRKRYDYLETWVEENDEILERADLGRKLILRVGAKTIILLLVAYVLQIASDESVLMSFVFLPTLYYSYANLFIFDDLMSSMDFAKKINSVVLVMTLIVVIGPYRAVYGQPSNLLLILWMGIILGVLAAYWLPEIRSLSGSIRM